MTRLAAHRGGARLWPENSLRGFRESLALGADLVELDVHLAADGALPVIHDATLRRTTDRLGRVRTRTAAELRRTTLLVSRMHVRLARARPADTVAWARHYGATDVGLKYTLVDETVIEAARAAGVAVGVWTVNEEPDMRRLIALGVDVLTSDRPDLALRALGRA